MTLEDIINATSVQLKDTTLILHKRVVPHQSVKILKTFIYDLYAVKNNVKNCIMTFSYTMKAASEELNIAWEESNKQFLEVFIDWIITSESFKELYGVQ